MAGPKTHRGKPRRALWERTAVWSLQNWAELSTPLGERQATAKVKHKKSSTSQGARGGSSAVPAVLPFRRALHVLMFHQK